MSSSIQSALGKLYSSVEKLEQAVEAKKSAPVSKKGTVPQDDLFGAITAGQKNPSNINPANVRMLASRLDVAINQVEQILKGGRG